ncbi:MAG: ATP synthase F1 subunit epsilon [Erysipelotrichaceae bacterium]|nr:ATP synthase F1 subunit epsilon [Erysipelotrichaceae bacterium]
MIHCRIVTPHGVYKEMETPIINIETDEGQRGILPNHMPLVTMLKIGKMETEEKGKRQEYAVAGGLFYFRENLAEILTDAIENKDEIDAERAARAKERAEQRLKSDDPNFDLQRARIALQKAINRMNVKGIQ